MSEYLEKYGPDAALGQTLVRWSPASQLPLVLLIDEIDSLVGDTLISVLTQLRANYDRRPGHFPQSVILCGVRDVRDYQIFSSREGTNVRGGGAFNIKAKSLRLGDFSEAEVRELLAQHTAGRGQAFEDGTAERIWALTCGQPWLVNALAYEACFDAETGRDRSRPIRVDAIDQARETLILRRVTHLDQFADKLDEERVRRVILAMLAGSGTWDYSFRDLEYVRDLGLVASEGAVRIANPIYAEVVPRELTAVLQSGLEAQVDPAWYVNADGSLDLAGLLRAFQGYSRENAESWVERFGHAEAGPQLVLHAYLQRVVKSGGRIGREYAVGRGRTDLLIEWRQGVGQGPVRTRKYVIECKVRTAKVGLDRLVREGRGPIFRVSFVSVAHWAVIRGHPCKILSTRNFGHTRIQGNLRSKRFLGTSENALKLQLWIPVSVYVLVAILRKRLEIDISLHTMLQLLSIRPFEQVLPYQALTLSEADPGGAASAAQPPLFAG